MFNTTIVIYNSPLDLLLKAINSIIYSDDLNKIYIIDNSEINSIEKYLPTSNKVIYIKSTRNGGFGFGHNIGINLSLKDYNVKYHLVLNPDVYFDSVILLKIIDFMDSNKNVGNLMPMVCYPDGSNQFLCKLLPTPIDWVGRRFNPFKKIVERRNTKFELRFTNYDKIMEVPYLSGCFMFLRLDALKEIGLFDEGIFMYGEETDLCRRLIANKYKTIFFPEVKIFHKFDKGSHKSFRLTLIGIQSAIYYFNKWGWFFDNQRDIINKNSLDKLGYNKHSL
jgi:GT2 family glycosyltransferase